MPQLPPLALQVEAAHRLALLLAGPLRYALPTPEIHIRPSGQVELVFDTGNWDRDVRAVELVARSRFLPRPLYRREHNQYLTENGSWRVVATGPTTTTPAPPAGPATNGSCRT